METTILGQGEAGADLIKETSTGHFVADVIDASHDAIILVDFWAPWCGPCKQLTPILEKAVREAGGAVRLVKLDIDAHPAVPGQMGIQSIPAVFAFKAGKPVDGFQGALPESEVKSFISRLLGPDAQAAATADLEAGQNALEAGDVNTAAQIFAMVLEKDKANADAIGGLAKCYLQTGDLARAEETLALTPPDKAASSAITSVQAMIDLARKSSEGADISALRAELENNPLNHQVRLDLALALNASDDREGAVEELLTIMRADRAWNDDGARTQLLQFFEAWGSQDPATVAGRQALSLLLFS